MPYSHGTCSKCGGQRFESTPGLCRACYTKNGTGKERPPPKPYVRSDSLKNIDYKRLEEYVIRPGIENKLIPLALYRGNLSLGDVHRRWNFTLAMMLAEAEHIYAARDLWMDETLAKLCFWNVKNPPSPIHVGSWIGRLYDNRQTVDNVPGLWEFVNHWYQTGKYHFKLDKIPLHHRDWIASRPWRPLRQKPKKDHIRTIATSPYEICYPFLIHKPDKIGNNQGHDLLMKINKAVGPLPRELKADVCQDLAVAILSGDMQESDLDGEVDHYVKKVMKMYPTKYGPLSLDAPMFDGRTLMQVLQL